MADDVTIRVGGQAKGVVDAVKAAVQAMQALSKEVQGLGTTTQQTTAAGRGMLGWLSSATATMTGFVGAQAVLSAVGSAMRFAKDAAFGMNAELETTTLQFETLMGDAQAARAHVEGLFEFAKRTPFETGPIIEASLKLQTFGGAALNTQENLRRIGDASAAVKAPIDDLAFWTGRLYSQLQSGRPFGEAALRLQELAVLSPQARNQMEALQESGASASEVFTVFEGELGRFTGAMEKQAGTWRGMLSTFTDAVQMTAAEGLKPLFDSAKRGMATVIEVLNDPRLDAAVKTVASRLSEGLGQAFRVLDGIGQEISAIWTAVSPHLETARTEIALLGSDLRTRLLPGLEASAAGWLRAGENALSFVRAAWDGLKVVGSGIWEAFRSTLQTLATLWSVVSQAVNGAVDILHEVLAPIASPVWSAFLSVLGAVASVWRLLMNVLEPILRLVTWLAEKFELKRRVLDALAATLAPVRIGFTVLGTVIEKVADVVKWAADKISELLELLGIADAELPPVESAFRGLAERGVVKLADESEILAKELEGVNRSARGAAGGASVLTGAAAEAAKKQAEWRKTLRELSADLHDAQRPDGAWRSLIDLMKESGSKIEEVTRQARVFGRELPAIVKKAADDMRAAKFVEAVAEATADLNADARKRVEGMTRDVRQVIRDHAQKQDAILQEAADHEARRTLTDLEYKQWALRRWRDEQRRKYVEAGLDSALFLSDLEAEYDTRLRAIVDEHDAAMREMQGQAEGYGATLVGVLEGIPELLVRAFTGGGGVTGAIQSVMSQLGSGLLKNLFSGSLNTNLSFGFAKLFGTGAAAALSNLLPGIGQAIGSVIGPLVSKITSLFSKPGWKDSMKMVGRDWGVSISEGLAQSIEQTSKDLFQGDRRSAELFHLDDIIGEAGGVTDRNLATFTRRLRDAFSFVETGKYTTDQARDVLDRGFALLSEHVAKSGRAASTELKELITLAQRFGIESTAITDFVRSNAASAGVGLAATIAPLGKAYEGLAEKIAAARAEQAQAAAGSGEAARATETLNSLLAQQTAGVAQHGTEVTRVGRLLLASFNGAKAQGLSYLETIEQLGPGLDQYRQTTRDLGLEIDNTALSEIVRFRELAAQYPELVQAAATYNQTVVAMSNLNALNAETLADLEAQGLSTYTRLTEAGFTEQQALAQIEDGLRAIIAAHQETGTPIDENTQRLVDQAKGYGLLKDQGQSTNDILKDGLSALIEAVGGELPAAWRTMREAAVTEAAAIRGATDTLSTAVEGVGQKLGAVDWKGWADGAVDAARGVQDEVDAISFGHSPGGLKEIPIMLRAALAATKAWATATRADLRAVGGDVDRVGLDHLAALQPAAVPSAAAIAAAVADAMPQPLDGGVPAMTWNVTTFDAAGLTSAVERKILPRILEATRANRGGARTKFRRVLATA